MILKFNKTLTAVVFYLISTSAFAQQYYVVIGVFSNEENASKFTGYARSKYLNAEYLNHPSQPLFYVFAMRTADKEQAFAQAARLREDTEFTDAWSYYGLLGNERPQPAEATEEKPVENKPPSIDAEPTIPKRVTPDTLTAQTLEPEVDQEEKILAPPKGKYFRFVLNTSEGPSIPGEVHHVDFEKGRELGMYKANEYVDITRPSGDQPMIMVCGVFGYQEVIKVVDFADPYETPGAYQDKKGAWVIPYQLKRLKEGDVSVMYHVSFFKDAVVMTKDSKMEMDELVNMMKLNPDYSIKIHGHCNGNYDRRIIALGQSENYFNIEGSNEIPGSAKDLTKLRAEAVQSYLEKNGINRERSKIFSWGGSHMLVGETSSSARLNDRIEIEIMKD